MDHLTLLLKSTGPFDGTTAHPEERHSTENAAARLNRTTFLALIGLFAGLAALAVSIRMFFHVYKRGKLFSDDIFVVLATACLMVATGFLYHMRDWMYMTAALGSNPKNAALYTKNELQLFPGLLKWNNLFLVFVWTSIMAVKLSFLALFWILIRDISRLLAWLWWFTAVATILSWLFNILRNPIVCGWSRGNKCTLVPRYVSELGWTSSGVDIATDVLIILIPILLLRSSLLHITQKLRILSFLCLNVFQMGICLGRSIGSGFHANFGIVNTFLLLHIEASVAVIMCGVTAFRTVFAARIREREHQRRSEERRSPGMYNSLFAWLKRSSGKSKAHGSANTRSIKKPFLTGELPGGTLRGLGTFIRRHDREPGLTTSASTAFDSGYDPLESYHEYMRKENTHDSAIPLQPVQNQEISDQIKAPPPTLQLRSN